MTTLLALAEEYYEGHKDACESLVAKVVASGADEGILDDLIHDGADAEGRDSEEASVVNNQGLAFQVASLMQGNGAAEGERLVREAASIGPAHGR